MADIAILVAEEYERRIKHSRKASENEEMKWVSCVSLVPQNLNINKLSLQGVEFLVKRLNLAPKTQIALAAYSGFFSA